MQSSSQRLLTHLCFYYRFKTSVFNPILVNHFITQEVITTWASGGGAKGSVAPSGFCEKIVFFSKLIFIKFILKKGIFSNFGFKFLNKLALRNGLKKATGVYFS